MSTASRPAVPTYSRVVVPLDGSLFAEMSRWTACRLTELLGARLELAGFGMDPADEAALENRLLSVAAEHGDAEVWTGIDWHIAEGVVDVADPDEPALVCIASHVGHSVEGALLGSVAGEVLGQWHEPVLMGPAVWGRASTS